MIGTAESLSVGIIGASGFAGVEFLRLSAGHPGLDVVLATADSQAGRPVSDLYPSLTSAVGGLEFVAADPAACDGLDVVVLALPHGVSQALVPDLIGRVGHIVDVAADFRFSDPAVYPEWYGAPHAAPELLSRFTYGLPELFRAEAVEAEHVAVAGCYPTCVSLALGPLVAEGLIEPVGIAVSAMSGVSGAGRPPKESTTFCAVDENVSAYGLLRHRHTPEIERNLSVLAGEPVAVSFTPHLVPMNRGIHATCTGRATEGATTEAVLEALHSVYDDQPCVEVIADAPHTKSCLGANTAHVTARVDERTGTVLSLGAIDNLAKGTSGQAIQLLNLMTGRPETEGLPLVGLAP